MLCNSYAEFDPAELGRAGKLVFLACDKLRLAHVERTAGSAIVRVSNLTIINYALFVLGPMHEARLTSVLISFQVVCNIAALVVRYQLAGLFYDVVR